ncbi:MAG: PepSY domain-containing protein [Candidatus Tectomicrobia bacterium]|uniref:PepSY domain-containing protein n=1 Tax=Tectimicrobiota bacterium TaxID=2528274 RepID=A0A932GSP6_UNCTE|nr:PepSY domain-containing protein [Candidatus Tectomicrobia bacterium]
MMGSYWGSPATGQPLTKEQATALVQNQLNGYGNPNLKIGNVTEKDGIFEVEIVTRDNSLVEKVQINKQTGWTQRAF